MTLRYLGGAALAVFWVALLYGSSHLPFQMARESESQLTVSFRIVPEANLHCHKATEEEKAKMLPHMRRDEICERARALTRMRVTMDGKEALDKTFKPIGLQSDGIVVALETLNQTAGEHDVRIEIKDSTKAGDWDYRFERKMTFREGYRALVEFQRDKGFQIY